MSMSATSHVLSTLVFNWHNEGLHGANSHIVHKALFGLISSYLFLKWFDLECGRYLTQHESLG